MNKIPLIKKAVLFTSLLCTSVVMAQNFTVEKTISRPELYFKSHPEQVLPEGMVIQGFTVHYDVKSDTDAPYRYKYELVEKQGQTRLSKAAAFTPDSKNSLLADEMGDQKVRITVADSKGNELFETIETVRVHFSRTQVAGGDVAHLDDQYKGSPEYVKGVIDEKGKLIYKGLRYLPSNMKNVDRDYEGGKYGFYETKEPRLLYVDKTGTLIVTYHAMVKGRNDAPPGLTFIVARSTDQGATWVDDQVILHDNNAVIAYTALAQVDNTIQLYFTGGHPSHRQYDKYVGVYRTISKDDGKTWSKPQHLLELSQLINGKSNYIGDGHALINNALQIKDMVWKGKKGDAILLAFYPFPWTAVISMDKGETWEIFSRNEQSKEKIEMNETSWVALPNKTIYVVSRRQATKGFKNELFFQWDGSMDFLGQNLKNHKARRTHQGAILITDGTWKNRVAVASNWSGNREEGTIALSTDSSARKFETRLLTTDSGFGYCDIAYDKKRDALIVVAEAEPYDANNQRIKLTKTPDRNERFSLQSYSFTKEYYDTLKVLIP